MRFKCTVRQDAWIFHECVVEAENAEAAAQAARDGWRHGDVKFTNAGASGFDHTECEAEDCEEIGP